jgi:hypothetical protein
VNKESFKIGTKVRLLEERWVSGCQVRPADLGTVEYRMGSVCWVTFETHRHRDEQTGEMSESGFFREDFSCDDLEEVASC